MATKRNPKKTSARRKPSARRKTVKKKSGVRKKSTAASARRRRTAVPKPSAIQRDRTKAEEKPDSLVQQAYQNILDRIVKLELEPGRAFTEGDLAGELGLSKTPVREALLMLRVRGFVFPRPRSGYRVTPITVKDVRDLFGLLKIIEPECAALAATRGVETKRIMLLEDLQVEVDPSDTRSIDEFIEAEIAFRRLLAYESGNERFFLLSEPLVHDLARLLRLTVQLAPLDSALITDHEKLMAALANGDATKAREISIHRLELLERFVLDTLLESDAVQGVNVGAPGLDREN